MFHAIHFLSPHSGKKQNRPNRLRALVAGRFEREAVVHAGSVPVGRRAFGDLARHRHADHSDPPQLELLGLGDEAVDGLGLGEPEAGRGVRGPGAVLYAVAQQGDGALGLHVLRVGGSRRALVQIQQVVGNLLLFCSKEKLICKELPEEVFKRQA